MILEKHCNNLIVWAIISFNGYNFHFCSIYLPPSELISDKIETLTQDINILKPKYLVIGGDTNAKSKFWFNTTNNTRGDEMIDFMVQENLILLNDSNLPTFLTSYGQSHIDLTLTNFRTS